MRAVGWDDSYSDGNRLTTPDGNGHCDIQLDCYSYTYCYCDLHAYTYCNGHTDCDSASESDSDSLTEKYTDAQTSAYAAAAPVSSVNLSIIQNRLRRRFAQFKLSAHPLNLERLLFKLSL